MLIHSLYHGLKKQKLKHASTKRGVSDTELSGSMLACKLTFSISIANKSMFHIELQKLLRKRRSQTRNKSKRKKKVSVASDV